MLDDKGIRAAMLEAEVVSGAPRKLYDGGGLTLEIRASGRIAQWAVKYRSEGAERRHPLGRYPAMSIKAARKAAHEFKTRLAGGERPHATPEPEQTFAAVADAWLTTNRPRLAANTVPNVERYLAYATAALGSVHVGTVTTPQVLKLLKLLEDRPPTMKKVRIYTGVVFDYAIATGMRTLANPVTPLARRGVLAAPKPVKSHAAMPLTDLPAWLTSIRTDTRYALPVRAAMRLLVLTALRTQNVLGLRWEWVAPDCSRINFPAEVMKARKPFTVICSQPVRSVLELMADTAPRNPDAYVFPGRRRGEPLSEMTLAMLLRRTYKGAATVHGFRSCASTALHSQGVPPPVVERMLAHANGDAVAAAYNRHAYGEELHDAWTLWAKLATGAAA